jgi:hypothetical protein
MCGGHHNRGGASHCCCGEGHAQHDCDCGGYSRHGCDCGSEHPSECRCGGHHGWGGASHCCCGEGHAQHGCDCGGHSRQGCDCGCHSQGRCGCGDGRRYRFHRRFRSRDDEVGELEEYLKDLEAEAKGVRERLAEVRGASAQA